MVVERCQYMSSNQQPGQPLAEDLLVNEIHGFLEGIERHTQAITDKPGEKPGILELQDLEQEKEWRRSCRGRQH